MTWSAVSLSVSRRCGTNVAGSYYGEGDARLSDEPLEQTA
eukprot:CAMPEP_0176454268 /NCGR_PEP_ID=MMETSP0127-20121128/29852_1 /TAXON_ID=938130 /ORGANISM="Platyophrya macrostoma, Strain WH" /LENGTH=39 /DNA_ID= /DNA_START= /DNA_END= /DNA_ORIENTATION=